MILRLSKPKNMAVGKHSWLLWMVLVQNGLHVQPKKVWQSVVQFCILSAHFLCMFGDVGTSFLYNNLPDNVLIFDESKNFPRSLFLQLWPVYR